MEVCLESIYEEEPPAEEEVIDEDVEGEDRATESIVDRSRSKNNPLIMVNSESRYLGHLDHLTATGTHYPVLLES